MEQAIIEDIENLRPHEFMRRVSKEGTLFFDSVGNYPKDYQNPLSIIATAPERFLRGHISDYSELEKVLKARSELKENSNFPCGGLAGWVDYEGNYTFGLYNKFWVYSHHEDRWIQEGNTAFAEMKNQEKVAMSPWNQTVSEAAFIDIVNKAQEYIASGDIYQVNLSHKFWAELECKNHVYSLYEKLRKASPAPMACYGNLGRRELICSSPETFLRMSGEEIESRPIKGTSPRFSDSVLDKSSAHELLNSEKEKAELLMITDLLRNDLGRVSEYGSVKVDELLSLETFEQVFHMVSTVRGKIKPELSHVAALASCLPGGSITGAPKIRATQIIKELEKTSRGLYTGVVGYLGFNGESQFNIAIRSLVREGGQLHYHVGAGIVADSDPEKEYQETLIKAEGIRRALADLD